jgi:hypothetical protein
MTAWQWAAYEGKLHGVLKLWEGAQDTLTKEEINNEVLLATDNKGMTVLHVAAWKGKLI